jgi:hypothetical protein
LIDFENITPEDVIGPGLRDRDWTERHEHEKKCTWHFHIAGGYQHACVTGVRSDSEAEAADRALEEFFVAVPEVHLGEFFANERWTYCTALSCGCPLVHVVRMQDRRLAETGPVAPMVVLLDLS